MLHVMQVVQSQAAEGQHDQQMFMLGAVACDLAAQHSNPAAVFEVVSKVGRWVGGHTGLAQLATACRPE
jgi:hypothetical protein